MAEKKRKNSHCVRLDDQAYILLAALAAQERRTLSAQISTVIDEYAQEHGYDDIV